MISLFLVAAPSKVFPQRLDFPAALLRVFCKAEVLHPLRNLGVDVSIVDEALQRLLNVLLAPHLYECQGFHI